MQQIGYVFRLLERYPASTRPGDLAQVLHIAAWNIAIAKPEPAGRSVQLHRRHVQHSSTAVGTIAAPHRDRGTQSSMRRLVVLALLVMASNYAAGKVLAAEPGSQLQPASDDDGELVTHITSLDKNERRYDAMRMQHISSPRQH
eukprot:135175-Pleurochrysis_carterae.AAC.3